MAAARQEFETKIAKRRVQTSLSQKPPVAHKFIFAPGHSVYVYHEYKNVVPAHILSVQPMTKLYMLIWEIE